MSGVASHCYTGKKWKSNRSLLTWQLMLLMVIMITLVVMTEEMTVVEQPKTMIDEIPCIRIVAVDAQKGRLILSTRKVGKSACWSACGD